jgi:hypothetical protein
MKINFKYTNNSNNLKNNIVCQDSETILDIKKYLCEENNIDESQLKLIFLGKILKDKDIIKDLNITDNDTLHVIIKQKTDNKHSENTNFTNIVNVLNNFQNAIQEEEFQNNINNTMNQFQQSFQNTLQSNEFQQGIQTIAGSLQQIQQDLQNTVESEEFQNNINNTINQFQQNMSNINSFNNSTNNEYSQEEEEKISALLDLNIINNRNQIIILLRDHNWVQEEVANILLYNLD